MEILYLPTKLELRAFIEIALEFVQQVYKDHLLARLKFIAFSMLDPRDMEEVKKFKLRFAHPHYDHKRAMAVVVEDPKTNALELFLSIVQEVAHHIFHGARSREKAIKALVRDVPALKTEIPMKRLSSFERSGLAWYVEELYTRYIVYNYFAKLNDKPISLSQEPGLLDEYSPFFEYVSLVSIFTRQPILIQVNSIVEGEMVRKRNPFTNFTATIHEMFTGAIKRLPVEVYNSNPSRYKVLYRRQRVDQLPL